jgi:hypothetical protein
VCHLVLSVSWTCHTKKAAHNSIKPLSPKR